MGQNGMKDRFRGSFIVKLDDRGRVKVPAKYLSIFESLYGRDVYLTSINGDHILFYPLSIWERIEQKIEAITVRDPDIEQFIDRISFWGTEGEIDPKGRVLVPSGLRESCKLVEDVLILGKVNYMVIWNREAFKSRYIDGVFTDEKMQKVSRLLNEFSTLSRDE
jgi:MraZ protein